MVKEIVGDSVKPGITYPQKQEIIIKGDMAKDIKVETLFHELSHLLLMHIGEYGLYENESFVQRLGNAMYILFKDNDLSSIIEEYQE